MEGFAILSPKGVILSWTIRHTEFECRNDFRKVYGSTWATLKRKGYSMEPVTVTLKNPIIEDKPREKV